MCKESLRLQPIALFEFKSNLSTDVKDDRRGITFVPPEAFRLTIV